MPKLKCKNLHCGKFVRIPPNRAGTSTGFLSFMLHKGGEKQWVEKQGQQNTQKSLG